MSNPSFTVIITTYKRPFYLKEALASVVNQDYKDFECLIINDFPEDNTLIENLVAEFRDSRLKFIACRQNRGGNYCRNKGISLAKGKYVAFLDDDDVWFKEKLKFHYKRHQQSGAVLVYSRYFKKDREFPEEEILSIGPDIPENIAKAMFKGSFSIGTTSTVTLEISRIPIPLFDEKLVSFQDWDAWISLALRKENLLFSQIKKPLLYFMQHEQDRTSRNLEKRKRGLEQIIQKYGGKQLLAGFYYKELMNIHLLEADGSTKKELWKRIFILKKFLLCRGFWWRNYPVRRVMKYLLLGR